MGDGTPFAHAMPHKPLAASERYYKQSGAGLYGDAISELDASVGQVLDKVKQLGLDESTFIVFTSDNGPWFGGSTGGLRGMKGTSWEGGYRVPFIARWPGKIPPGHVSALIGSDWLECWRPARHWLLICTTRPNPVAVYNWPCPKNRRSRH